MVDDGALHECILPMGGGRCPNVLVLEDDFSCRLGAIIAHRPDGAAIHNPVWDRNTPSKFRSGPGVG